MLCLLINELLCARGRGKDSEAVVCMTTRASAISRNLKYRRVHLCQEHGEKERCDDLSTPTQHAVCRPWDGCPAAMSLTVL